VSGGDQLELALGSLRGARLIFHVPREERPGACVNQLVWEGKLEFRADAAKQDVTLDLTKEDVESIAQAWAEAKAAERAEGKR
jgi:hypothetical protein